MTLLQATQQLQSGLVPLYDEREAGNIAALVMERVTGWKRIDRVLNKQYDLLPGQLDMLKNYTAQLLQHRPVQYVLEEAWFYDMQFYVDEHVLIPRPETEELVDWIVQEINSNSGKKNEPTILDVGTGSGCIAIALKKELPGAQVWACDVSEDALHVARRNAAANEVQVNFLPLDFLQPGQRTKLPVVDILVSNPPYIPLNNRAAMHPRVLRYEPHGALFVADNDPLTFYKAIADFTQTHLRYNGAIYTEIHEHMAAAIKELFYARGFHTVEIKQDLQGKDRMVKASVLNLDSTDEGIRGLNIGN